MAFELKDILHDLHARIDALSLRASYAKATERLKDEGNIDAGVDAFKAELEKAPDAVKTELAGLKTTLDEKLVQLTDVATKNDAGEWVANNAQRGFSKEKTAYTHAQDTIKEFLKKGKPEKDGVAKIDVPQELTSAYKTLETRIDNVEGLMDGFLGHLRVDGFSAAAKHNLKNMNLFDKTITKNRGGELAMRYGTVAAGAALTLDAIARGTQKDKDKDNEPRSVIARILEGAVGVAAMGGGVMVGRAL